MVSECYTPIQIPFLLNADFLLHSDYEETHIPILHPHVICMWTMLPKETEGNINFTNIIVPDACIDVVVNYSQKSASYGGMSRIAYDQSNETKDIYFGFRMKPGAYNALSEHDARSAMDKILPIKDIQHLFSQSLEETQNNFIHYLKNLMLTESEAMKRFDTLYHDDSINTVQKIADCFHFSLRQSHRFCLEHFGLGPKMILDIIRFQKALSYLLSNDHVGYSDLALASGYYDHAHFSKDIKKNIGISPRELIHVYQEHDRFIQE